MKKLTTLIFLIGLATTASAGMISEFEPNPDGSDPAMQTIEISGTPGAMFDLHFLTIEAEGGNTGVIDSLNRFMGTYDANGLATFDVDDIENPSYTAILADGFDTLVMEGEDLDTDNDGTLDLTPWTSITDSLNVPDSGSSGSGDTFYGSNSVSVPPITHDDEPISVFRDSMTGDWYSINEDVAVSGVYAVFDASGTMVAGSSFNINPETTTSTFGALNPFVVPEPAAFTLAGIVGLALMVIRKR